MKMQFEIVYSEERHLNYLEQRERAVSIQDEAYLTIKIINELQKKVALESKEDEQTRMSEIKRFQTLISNMTFSEFILAFPRDDGGDYTPIEDLYRSLRLNVHDKLGDHASEIIAKMSVNSKINLFKNKVEEFRRDRQCMFYANGELNEDYEYKE